MKDDAPLRTLQQADWAGATASLWIVKRRLAERRARYEVLGVDIDARLQQRLHREVAELVAQPKRMAAYEFVSEDQDDTVLTLASDETDFPLIETQIDKGLDAPRAKSIDDLLNSWCYVVRLQRKESRVHAVKKTAAQSSTRRVRGLRNLLWEDHMLIDLDERQVFTLASGFDFFAHGGTLFICNKRQFESALNFRLGMERVRDAVLPSLPRLRRVSALDRNGYYRDRRFMQRLLELNDKEGWGLNVQGGRIVVDEGNVDTVLLLLNNGRLRSPVNQETFDALVKKKVE